MPDFTPLRRRDKDKELFTPLFERETQRIAPALSELAGSGRDQFSKNELLKKAGLPPDANSDQVKSEIKNADTVLRGEKPRRFRVADITDPGTSDLTKVSAFRQFREDFNRRVGEEIIPEMSNQQFFEPGNNKVIGNLVRALASTKKKLATINRFDKASLGEVADETEQLVKEFAGRLATTDEPGFTGTGFQELPEVNIRGGQGQFDVTQGDVQRQFNLPVPQAQPASSLDDTFSRLDDIERGLRLQSETNQPITGGAPDSPEETRERALRQKSIDTQLGQVLRFKQSILDSQDKSPAQIFEESKQKAAGKAAGTPEKELTKFERQSLQLRGRGVSVQERRLDEDIKNLKAKIASQTFEGKDIDKIVTSVSKVFIDDPEGAWERFIPIFQSLTPGKARQQLFSKFIGKFDSPPEGLISLNPGTQTTTNPRNSEEEEAIRRRVQSNEISLEEGITQIKRLRTR